MNVQTDSQFTLEKPPMERMSFIAKTRAVEPLERASAREEREVPETFPTGV